VEQNLEARIGSDAHVEARRRDPVGLFELGPVDEIARERILDPEIVRRIARLFGLLLGKPRPREIRQPIHAGVPSLARAKRTASLNWRTLRKTRSLAVPGSP